MILAGYRWSTVWTLAVQAEYRLDTSGIHVEYRIDVSRIQEVYRLVKIWIKAGTCWIKAGFGRNKSKIGRVQVGYKPYTRLIQARYRPDMLCIRPNISRLQSGYGLDPSRIQADC